MTFPVIEESTVLRATTDYLIGRGVLPYRFSVARGKGIDSSKALTALSDKFKAVGFNCQFYSSGADIEGLSEKEWWRIECKGTGIGKGPTQRNNFDRALASAVSYFETPPFPLGPSCAKAKLFLGLALPSSPDYLRELKRRVRSPLRTQLNLWVLLCEPVSDSVREIPPSQEL